MKKKLRFNFDFTQKYENIRLHMVTYQEYIRFRLEIYVFLIALQSSVESFKISNYMAFFIVERVIGGTMQLKLFVALRQVFYFDLIVQSSFILLMVYWTWTWTCECDAAIYIHVALHSTFKMFIHIKIPTFSNFFN